MDAMKKVKQCPICGSKRKCFNIMDTLIACIGSPHGDIKAAGYRYANPDKAARYGIYEIEKGGSNG